MEVHKSMKLFGLYVYVSSCRMKRRSKRDEIMRSRRHAQKRFKLQLYEEQGGMCEMCGLRYDIEHLESHHILSVSERPDLAFEKKNLVLLCHDCHRKAHGKTDGAKFCSE